MKGDANFDDGPGGEWLVATGRGGYALGTVSGIPTRRYHGFLVVGYPPPRGREMIWARTEEVLVTPDGERVGLAGSLFGDGVVVPAHLREASGFERRPDGVQWTYEFGAGRLTRRWLMEEGRARITYRWEGPGPGVVEVRPLLCRRSHHHLPRRTGTTFQVEEGAPEELLVRESGGPSPVVVSWSPGCEIRDSLPHRYWNAWLPWEGTRGYDDREDLMAPALWACDLKQGEVWLQVRVEDAPAPLPRSVPSDPVLAARQAFLIQHPDGRPGIIAGYPWFTEWARDSMIALPGLLLPEQPALAAQVLEAWGSRMVGGLLPNQLRDLGDGPLATNSADAPLWFVRAVGSLLSASSGHVTPSLTAAVDQVLKGYTAGTDHGIGVDDELVHAEEEGEALTWMDARVSEGPVTGRRGKPIELSAMWVEALDVRARLHDRDGQSADGKACRKRRQRAAENLARRFVDSRTGVLRDVVDGRDPDHDGALRPNVLMALRVAHVPWSAGVAEKTLRAVESRLLVPVGVRTLDPGHRDYRGTYGGAVRARDLAYHQGTAWPWLLGPFVDAYLQVRGNTSASHRTLSALLTLSREGLIEDHALPEVHDGDEPHHPGGCPAQAWSVAEVVRGLSAVKSLR